MAKVLSMRSTVYSLFAKAAPALLISTSILGSCLWRLSASSRIEACEERSAIKSLGEAAATAEIAFSARFPRSAFRQTETIVAPCFAKARAVAKPMPEFAPVITIILFLRHHGRYPRSLAVASAPWAGLASPDGPDTLGL